MSEFRAHWDIATVIAAALLGGFYFDGFEGAVLSLAGAGLGGAIVYRIMREGRR